MPKDTEVNLKKHLENDQNGEVQMNGNIQRGTIKNLIRGMMVTKNMVIRTVKIQTVAVEAAKRNNT
jgi:hypothetical protein